MIGGEPGHRTLHDVEGASLDRQTVEKHRRDDDPTDREEPEAGAVERGRRRGIQRHADDADGHAEGREKTGQRRALRRPPAAREQSQQHHQRQHRHERGEERGTERIVDMIPDHRRLLGAQKATSIAARPAIPTTTSPAPSQRAIGGRSE